MRVVPAEAHGHHGSIVRLFESSQALTSLDFPYLRLHSLLLRRNLDLAIDTSRDEHLGVATEAQAQNCFVHHHQVVLSLKKEI